MYRLICILVLVWSPALLGQSSVYQVNSSDSFIHIYTGTEGALRVFSHRHLIAITDIKGQLVLSDEGNHARLALRPESFLVDDEIERARAADPEFREPVAEHIQADTRANMLGPRVLDAQNHPLINVEIRLERLSATPLLDVKVFLLGVEKTLQIPAILEVDEQRIWATGYFELMHADLGLEPYTALGGLMGVSEELRMQFEILAEAIPATDDTDN